MRDRCAYNFMYAIKTVIIENALLETYFFSGFSFWKLLNITIKNSHVFEAHII